MIMSAALQLHYKNMAILIPSHEKIKMIYKFSI